MKIPIWKLTFGWLVLIIGSVISGMIWSSFALNFPYQLVGYLTPIIIVLLVVSHYTINKKQRKQLLTATVDE